MLKIYFGRNLLTLNENKSKIMVFRNGGRLAQNDKWYWGEQQLSVTTKYQYLGYPLTTANSLNKVSAYYKGKKALATIGAVWKVLTNSTSVNWLHQANRSRCTAAMNQASGEPPVLQRRRLIGVRPKRVQMGRVVELNLLCQAAHASLRAVDSSFDSGARR
ncbi:hypothetical protein LAZ67_5003019 [Cordylochernes scorpioides]|uniref:Uncharacterized protein n=1 Tax=Cordylochernes scorpioides TaxID=51811 RepID=A0ABY6KJW0_9ARAC|nr:hypothetical protein LAZ67_5003019 [Cordylochernes scorpioides]